MDSKDLSPPHSSQTDYFIDVVHHDRANNDYQSPQRQVLTTAFGTINKSSGEKATLQGNTSEDRQGSNWRYESGK